MLALRMYWSDRLCIVKLFWRLLQEGIWQIFMIQFKIIRTFHGRHANTSMHIQSIVSRIYCVAGLVHKLCVLSKHSEECIVFIPTTHWHVDIGDESWRDCVVEWSAGGSALAQPAVCGRGLRMGSVRANSDLNFEKSGQVQCFRVHNSAGNEFLLFAILRAILL